MTLENATRPQRTVVVTAIIALLFGLLFAYDVWEALGNLFGIVTYANGLRVAIAGWGWVVLVGAAVLPAALWAGATWLSWKRPVGQQLVVQLTALAVSATSYVSIITMFNDTNLFVLQ